MAAKNFLAGFASLLKEIWQTDVQLKAMDSDPGAAISVHKILLAATSKVFKKMFEEDECKASSGEEIIIFSEMKHEELQALVHFFYIPYSSKFKRGHKKHVRSLYLAADKYEIRYLRKICRDELVSSVLNLANVFDVLELAQIPFDKDLNDAVVNYITENINTIADSVELKEFADSNPNLTLEVLKPSLKRSRCSHCVCDSCCDD